MLAVNLPKQTSYRFEPVEHFWRELSIGVCAGGADAPPAARLLVAMRGPAWSVSEKQRLAELRASGMSMAAVADALGRPVGSVMHIAFELSLPQKKPLFFRVFFNNQRIYFKLPLRPGIKKLLSRLDKLLEWVEEGRDNYELARAFHVPNPDVAYVVARLGLKRPYDDPEPVEEALSVRRKQTSAVLFNSGQRKIQNNYVANTWMLMARRGAGWSESTKMKPAHWRQQCIP